MRDLMRSRFADRWLVCQFLQKRTSQLWARDPANDVTVHAIHRERNPSLLDKAPARHETTLGRQTTEPSARAGPTHFGGPAHGGLRWQKVSTLWEVDWTVSRLTDHSATFEERQFACPKILLKCQSVDVICNRVILSRLLDGKQPVVRACAFHDNASFVFERNAVKP